MSDQQLTGRYDIQAVLDRDDTGERWLTADVASLATQDADTQTTAVLPIPGGLPTALRRRRIRARIRRLTGVGTVLSAIAVAVAGAMLFGTDGDQLDTASSVPQTRANRPAPKATPSTRPTARTTPHRPTRGQATPRPTATAVKPVVPAAPVTPARPTASAPTAASQLQHLGDLLQDDARVMALDELRSAAANLDQAATEFSGGNTASAEAFIQRAFEKVADTQRTGNWQPSRSESELLASFGYRPPTTWPGTNHHHHD